MKRELKCAGCGESLIIEGDDFYLGYSSVICPACCRGLAYPGPSPAITPDEVRSIVREELAAAKIVPR